MAVSIPSALAKQKTSCYLLYVRFCRWLLSLQLNDFQLFTVEVEINIRYKLKRWAYEQQVGILYLDKTDFLYRRQGKGKSLMKTLRLHIIVIERHNACHHK